MLKEFFTRIQNKRRLRKLRVAVAVVEAAGFTVCRIEDRGDTAYIADENGAWRKIGRKA